MQLTHDEARVRDLRGRNKIAEGVTFIKEGDTEDTDFMLLVLDGEVTIESIVSGQPHRADHRDGAGARQPIGEMACSIWRAALGFVHRHEHGTLRYPHARGC